MNFTVKFWESGSEFKGKGINSKKNILTSLYLIVKLCFPSMYDKSATHKLNIMKTMAFIAVHGIDRAHGDT